MKVKSMVVVFLFRFSLKDMSYELYFAKVLNFARVLNMSNTEKNII